MVYKLFRHIKDPAKLSYGVKISTSKWTKAEAYFLEVKTQEQVRKEGVLGSPENDPAKARLSLQNSAAGKNGAMFEYGSGLKKGMGKGWFCREKYVSEWFESKYG